MIKSFVAELVCSDSIDDFKMNESDAANIRSAISRLNLILGDTFCIWWGLTKFQLVRFKPL